MDINNFYSQEKVAGTKYLGFTWKADLSVLI